MPETLPDPNVGAIAPDSSTVTDLESVVHPEGPETPDAPELQTQQDGVSADDFAPPPLSPLESDGTSDAPTFSVVRDVTQNAPIPDGVKRNKDGSIPKPRGRKPGQKNAAASPATVSQEADSAAVYATALAMVNIATGSLASLIGPEWAPEKGEAEELAGYGAAYMRSKGITDPPPGIVLLLALGGYAAKRTQHANTLDKMKAFGIRSYLWARSLIWK